MKEHELKLGEIETIDDPAELILAKVKLLDEFVEILSRNHSKAEVNQLSNKIVSLYEHQSEVPRLALPQWLEGELLGNYSIETKADLKSLSLEHGWNDKEYDEAMYYIDVIKAYCNPLTHIFVEVK